MSRRTWEQIKSSKRFYVNTYRLSANFLFISVMINILFCILIAYVYFNQSSLTFYATYGGTAPVRLTPMNTPNESSVPLLQQETQTEVSKLIPD